MVAARVLLGIDIPGWSVLLVPAAATILVGVTVWLFHLGMRQYGQGLEPLPVLRSSPVKAGDTPRARTHKRLP